MTTLPDGLRESRVCYLETRGRISGKPHEIEIWFAAQPGATRLYVMAGGGLRADWVRNLRAEPRVRVRVGATTLTGQARVIAGAADEPLARALLADKYGERDDDGGLSRWARESLPVAIDLDADTACA